MFVPKVSVSSVSRGVNRMQNNTLEFSDMGDRGRRLALSAVRLRVHIRNTNMCLRIN